MIVFIDNYDSFTYNIVQTVERLSGEKVTVLRSKESTLEIVEALKPNFLIVGPGPGDPSDGGISIPVIKHFAGKVPILGVCLGNQAIGAAYGAKIIHAKSVVHGKVIDLKTDGEGIFRSLGKSGSFVRYNSLVIDESTLPKELEVTARSSDGDIMGVRVKNSPTPVEGVQFHPESVASSGGDKIFLSFLHYRKDALKVPTILNKLIKKEDLSSSETYAFMSDLTQGILDERATAAILTALAAKGESSDELFGAAKVLKELKTPLPIAGDNLSEIVGTGGDGKGSFNISSLSAIVAASCGAKVAKHGNKAVSSKSGAADFYKALGLKIDTKPSRTAEIIKKTGFGFLMAPIYHGAMKAAAPVRAALGIKTMMNILGPLSNPAGAAYQVLGVYSDDLLKPVGRAAIKLGAKRVMVVHSASGYDEISPAAMTKVFQITGEKEYEYTIDPTKFGLSDIDERDLDGGTAKENAMIGCQILSGGGARGLVAAVNLNAGAVLYLSGRAKTLLDGYNMAANAIKNGTAQEKLNEIIKVTNEDSKESTE